jgi:hypothetical protein
LIPVNTKYTKDVPDSDPITFSFAPKQKRIKYLPKSLPYLPDLPYYTKYEYQISLFRQIITEAFKRDQAVLFLLLGSSNNVKLSC